MESNFEMQGPDAMDMRGTPYDYKSIMQYHKKIFRKTLTGDTMEAKWDPNMILGGAEMSEADKKKVYDLYQCKSKIFSVSKSIKNCWLVLTFRMKYNVKTEM